jgi:3-phenylpropionate/trans-cinnamate dioxygenase ferredoxin reductase subunit
MLRTVDGADRLRRSLTGAPRVAVVGAGFIGCEVASTARSLGCEVTILEAAPTPMLRALGGDVGSVIARLHRR